MQRHCKNAQAVAEYLEGHEKISWVKYCGLKSDRDYELAKKYLPNGSCGVVSFGVKGGRAAAEKFMAGLKIAAIETHGRGREKLLPASCQRHPPSAQRRRAYGSGSNARTLFAFPAELKIRRILLQILLRLSKTYKGLFYNAY